VLILVDSACQHPSGEPLERELVKWAALLRPLR
jgi:hypothetical protein